MSLVIPTDELTGAEIRAVEERTKQELLRLGRAKRPAAQWLVRHVVTGNSPTDFEDLTLLTAAVAGLEEWLVDTADLTAGDLKSIFAANETLNNGQFIGFYGWSELQGPGQFSAAQLSKGQKVLDFWQLQHLWNHARIEGVVMQPAVWSEQDSITVKIALRAGATVVAGEDYPVMFRNVLVEDVSVSKAYGVVDVR